MGESSHSKTSRRMSGGWFDPQELIRLMQERERLGYTRPVTPRERSTMPPMGPMPRPLPQVSDPGRPPVSFGFQGDPSQLVKRLITGSF